MARLVLVGGTDVDEIDVALAALLPQSPHVIDAQRLHAILGGHALGDRGGLNAAGLAGVRRRPRAAALERQAGELPAHRSVLERDDRVGQTHASQRFGADVVSGRSTSSPMRNTSSPPGTLIAPGMQPR